MTIAIFRFEKNLATLDLNRQQVFILNIEREMLRYTARDLGVRNQPRDDVFTHL